MVSQKNIQTTSRKTTIAVILQTTNKLVFSRFVAEESSYGNALPELTDDPTWIIDPIDGTANFVRKIKLICISIGFAVNKKLVAAICYNPCMDEMYTAKRGMGAYLNGERIYTSPCTKFEDSIFALSILGPQMGGKIDRQKIMARTQAFFSRCPGNRVFGSVAITLCYISSGLMDAYNVENMGPWDCAGGILLIEEAGGCVKDVSGGPYDIMKPRLVCASTEELCNEMLRIINEADSKVNVH